MFWLKNSIWVFFGCEHHSFWGRLAEREKVDLGSLLSRAGIKRSVCLKVIVTGKLFSSWSFESFGDETSGVFESLFLAFLQRVFPKIMPRSVDITACVPRREPQYSSVYWGDHLI